MQGKNLTQLDPCSVPLCHLGQLTPPGWVSSPRSSLSLAQASLRLLLASCCRLSCSRHSRCSTR